MYDYVLQYGFDKDTEQFIQNIQNYLKENKVKDEEMKKEIGYHI